MPLPFSLSQIAAALLLAASCGANAQELVVNGEFDTDLLGWTLPQPMDATWVAFDRGNALSGSALLFNGAAEANTKILLLRQCFVPTRSGTYQLSAQGFIPPNQQAGRLVVFYTRFLLPQCQGLSVGRGFFLTSIGSWSAQAVTFGALTVEPADVGRVSFEVTVSLEKFPAGGSILATIDSVSLERMVLFANGFD